MEKNKLIQGTIAQAQGIMDQPPENMPPLEGRPPKPPQWKKKP